MLPNDTVNNQQLHQENLVLTEKVLGEKRNAKIFRIQMPPSIVQYSFTCFPIDTEETTTIIQPFVTLCLLLVLLVLIRL